MFIQTTERLCLFFCEIGECPTDSAPGWVVGKIIFRHLLEVGIETGRSSTESPIEPPGAWVGTKKVPDGASGKMKLISTVKPVLKYKVVKDSTGKQADEPRCPCGTKNPLKDPLLGCESNRNSTKCSSIFHMTDTILPL